MDTTVVETRKNPGCLVQILWFLLVGIWLGQIWIAVAYLFMLSVIGIPVGVWMLDRVAMIMALRGEPVQVLVSYSGSGKLVQRNFNQPQVNFFLRALYFILVGFWLAAIWMEIAYALCVTVILMPVGFWMFDRVPAILTLRR